MSTEIVNGNTSDSVQSRLLHATIDGSGSDAISAARQQTILEERARQLAKPLKLYRDDRDDREVILFTVKRETYALDCGYIRAIARAVGITPVPGTPASVAGVKRIGGEIHCVFNLPALLGGAPQPLVSDGKVIALGEDRIEFCLLADEVTTVAKFAPSDIHPRDSDRDHQGKSFIQGMTTGAVLVLDAAAILRDRNLYIGGVNQV